MSVFAPGKQTVTITGTGSTLAEQKTDSDLSGGSVTFGETVTAIEIFNKDASNDGVFTVNGFAITVPSQSAYARPVGGTPSATVTVTGSTSFEIRRLT